MPYEPSGPVRKCSHQPGLAKPTHSREPRTPTPTGELCCRWVERPSGRSEPSGTTFFPDSPTHANATLIRLEQRPRRLLDYGKRATSECPSLQSETPKQKMK